jgi:hypothetical protein
VYVQSDVITYNQNCWLKINQIIIFTRTAKQGISFEASFIQDHADRKSAALLIAKDPIYLIFCAFMTTRTVVGS